MQHSSGHEPSQWLQQVVLPPILEPGEQIGTIGLAYVQNFPAPRADGSPFWMFDGMIDLHGKPVTNGDHQALIAITTHRMLVMPCAVTKQNTSLYGVTTIRWAAVREAVIPKKNIQKHGLNLVVKNPNRPAENGVFQIYFWSKEDDVATHADFVARAGQLAIERVAATRASGAPEPALFFESPSTAGIAMPPPTPPPYPVMQPQAGAPRTSGMAITGFVLAFFCSLLGVIFSAIAMSQIKKSNGALKGQGLAVAGLVISIVGMLLGFLILTVRKRRFHF
jgi:hypothetical protein